MRPSTSAARSPVVPEINLIARRIVKLAEIATLEHMESLMASQARTLVMQARRAGDAGPSEVTPGLHRRTGVSPSLGGTDA